MATALVLEFPQLCGPLNRLQHNENTDVNVTVKILGKMPNEQPSPKKKYRTTNIGQVYTKTADITHTTAQEYQAPLQNTF
jgi:hypothetical protein